MAIPFYYSERFCRMSLDVVEGVARSGFDLDIRPVCVDDQLDALPPDVSRVPCIRTDDGRIVVGADIMPELARIASGVRSVAETTPLTPGTCFALAYEHVTIPGGDGGDDRGDDGDSRFDERVDRLIAERRAQQQA